MCAACGRSPAAPPIIEVKVSGQGAPVVFIPGLGTPGSVWDDTVARLQATHTCYVVTLAGFGGQPPVVPRREHFLADVREAIIASLRELRIDRPVIVGHSLGGVVALDLAAHAPDLPGSLVIVDALPFLAAMMGPDTQTEEAAQKIAARVSQRFIGQTPEQFAEAQQGFIGGMVTDPAKARALAAQTAKSDPATIGQAMSELIGHDLRARLSAIKCPVLVLGALADKTEDGTKREVVEAAYRKQYAAMPQTRFQFFDKARHFIMVDDPAGFNEALGKALPPPEATPAPAAAAQPSPAAVQTLTPEDANRARKEASYAKQVALACKLYAGDNDGNFPPDLADLYPTYLESPKIFLSPFGPASKTAPAITNAKEFRDFIHASCAFDYYPGKDTDPERTVLLRSKYPGPDGLRTVVYVTVASERVK